MDASISSIRTDERSIYALGASRTGRVRCVGSIGTKPPVHAGEGCNAKSSEEQVREMRCLHKEGRSGVLLAAHFGVTPRTVSPIVRNLTWKHVRDNV